MVNGQMRVEKWGQKKQECKFRHNEGSKSTLFESILPALAHVCLHVQQKWQYSPGFEGVLENHRTAASRRCHRVFGIKDQ